MQKNTPNRLINETSPYLLQHAHNPVDWFPWGTEALTKARQENKVILISIGYAACHWCHVMEKESFEQHEIAAIMNADFVCVKVDREERPDVDHIYMDAVQLMTGSGGWPLNVFLTPDAKPFYGGTYFPPVNAFNRSSWTEVLQGVANAWQTRRQEVTEQADRLTNHLEQSGNLSQFQKSISGDNDVFSVAHAKELFDNIMRSADKEWGGFGQAPKFPQTFTIQFLLQYYHFTDEEVALEQAVLSVDKMLQGGIYDQLAGGLARYSTDAEWLAPHFEKMLYDNALLIGTLCDIYQVTKNEKYGRAIDKTIAFIEAELQDETGVFFAALDADSEGEEGKYYVWEKAEVDGLLKDSSGLFCRFFDITEKGNWEGKNICRVLVSEDHFLVTEKISKTDFETLIAEGTTALLAERNKRIKPALDDKIILSWNALMVKAIAKAGIVLKNDHYIQVATHAFAVLEKNFTVSSESAALLHTYKDGIAKYPGFLEDYAAVIDACIELYAATADVSYLDKAKNYCSFVTSEFSDPEDLFFYFTGMHQADVLVRKKEIYDGAQPSGNSVMAYNLMRLGLLYDNTNWRLRAEKMLAALTDTIVKYPGSFGIWASLLLQNLAGIIEVVVIGPSARQKTAEINSYFIPNKIIMQSQNRDDRFPLLYGKIPDKDTLIYICKNYACNKPVSSVQKMMDQVTQDFSL